MTRRARMDENRAVRLVLALFALVAAAWFATSAAAGDWLLFGFDPARSNAPAGATGITAANVGSLVRQQVKLPNPADSSAAYLHGVRIDGATHDAFFVTTSYGRLLAVDADTGNVLWQFVPRGIGSFEHTAQITESSPLVDPDRVWIYTASPDGKIHKVSVADGSETTAGGWPVVVTLDPTHEKVASALNESGSLLLVAVGSYFGFAPYQGHVVSIDRQTGRIVHVFNASCSNRTMLLDPTSCPISGPGMWARSGVVVEPSGRLLVATANGLWNGKTAWADSVLELTPDAGKLLQSFTPSNQNHLGLADLDLGSTAPAILTPHVALQGGKDGKLRLLDLDALNGHTRSAGKLGGQLQLLTAPGGREVITTPAVWHFGGRVWAFVVTFSGITAYRLALTPRPTLQRAWGLGGVGGSSPIVAGGLLYVYSPLTGALNVFNPTNGKRIAQLPAGLGHWNSPIVADSRIALPEGDANQHSSTGILDIYRLRGA